MHTTLDHLEHHIKNKKSIKNPRVFLKEFKVFILLFILTFVGMLLFTNAQLFFGGQNNQDIVERNDSTIQQNNKISVAIDDSEKKIKEIEETIKKYSKELVLEKQTVPKIEDQLKFKIKYYDFDFNILPPTNRLIIKKINLDVPLVDSKYKNKHDFSQGDFDEELQNGVVKYPTTPIPGMQGNTLFFGHTSQEWREHNPYGTVFSNIPDLENGDIISLIWEGNLYEYKIVEKIIVKPSQVNNQYQKYQGDGKDFVTIMGCYPLGRTDKRMMITAKRIDNI